MKIGDRVRFLDAVGGGKVTGFQGKDIVLVEDQDGFDIPVLIRNCVVVDSDQEKRMSGETPRNLASPAKESKPTVEEPEVELEPADRPVTYKAAPVERKGGDKLNVVLCFEPLEVKELSKTEFDIYLVNDSNYTINFTLLYGENANWMLRSIDTAEANTKVYLETIAREDLNEWQRLCIQILAFKERKTFMLKQPISTELRLDLTKFYKLHQFAPNEFFTNPVLTFPVVENDQPVGDIRRAMLSQLNAEPETPVKKSSRPMVLKSSSKEDEVIDLHVDELLDSTSGMTPADILEYQMGVFSKKMAEVSRIKGKRIVFIHGKGEGVLRNRIVTELKRKYPRCNWQDASFREYGFGATLVIVH